VRKEIGEIVFVGGRKKHLRRTADTKPGQLRQRLVGEQPPAQVRHRGFEVGGDVGERQSRSLTPGAFNSPGSV